MNKRQPQGVAPTVIISATELEMALLLKELECVHQEKISGFDVCFARHNQEDIYLVKSDPGQANAAAATAVAIERYRPCKIFNVGVCGVYSDEKNLLTNVVVGISAVFADAGVKTDDSFMPLETVNLHLAKTKNGAKVFNIIKLNDEHIAKDVVRGVFLTVDACSGGSQRAQDIKNRFKIDEGKLLCEDMESAAVGLIALRAAIPCTVLRGISNLCGERDHNRWKLAEAAEAAQKELLKHL